MNLPLRHSLIWRGASTSICFFSSTLTCFLYVATMRSTSAPWWLLSRMSGTKNTFCRLLDRNTFEGSLASWCSYWQCVPLSLHSCSTHYCLWNVAVVWQSCWEDSFPVDRTVKQFLSDVAHGCGDCLYHKAVGWRSLVFHTLYSVTSSLSMTQDLGEPSIGSFSRRWRELRAGSWGLLLSHGWLEQYSDALSKFQALSPSFRAPRTLTSRCQHPFALIW